MSPKLKRVARTLLQSFLGGAVAALAQAQWSLAGGVDLTWARALGLTALSSGVTAVVAVIHNFILDPAGVPSLAPAEPVAAPVTDANPPTEVAAP